MDKFKYKFSIKIYIVAAIGTLLAVACFIFNVIRLVNFVKNDLTTAYNIISVSIAIIMSIGFLVIILAMFFDSAYIFGESVLTVKFGVIRSNTEYSKIKQLVYFKANNKLTIFYEDESFNNIVISENEYSAFAQRLLLEKPDLIYYEDINEQK